MESKTKVSSYKGHPTLSLNADSRYPFTFGVEKAKLVLAHIEEIKSFVARYEPLSADPMGVDRAYEDDCAARTGT